MADWNTRLAVFIDTDKDPVTPIDSFSPAFTLAADALHSLEATHVGAVFAPRDIKFSMTVKAAGDAVGRLTALAVQGKRFSVSLVKSEDSVGDDWTFNSIVLSDCLIISVQPTNATVTGAPTAVFQCVSLQGKIDAKNGGIHNFGRNNKDA